MKLKNCLQQFASTPVATIIASVLSTFIIAGAFFKFAGPVPISVTQTSVEKQTTFDVTGESSINTIPDTAQVNLGITVNSSTVADVQNQANQTINQIKDALLKLGLNKQDIKTTHYSLYPDYDYRSSKDKVTGYNLTATLNIKTTDFNKLNQAIDTATNLGANQIDRVIFILSQEKQKEIESEARKEAINQAKQKAKELAQISGIKLGKLINVQESKSNVQPIPLRSYAALTDTPEQEATEIEPGSTEVKLFVTLSYETL